MMICKYCLYSYSACDNDVVIERITSECSKDVLYASVLPMVMIDFNRVVIVLEEEFECKKNVLVELDDVDTLVVAVVVGVGIDDFCCVKYLNT